MKELWLIRHGETAWNQERRWQGHTDIQLNPLGEQQARTLTQRLQRVAFDHIETSDLSRAVRTAELALPHVERAVDQRLRELSFGTWEGRTWTELKEEDPDGLMAWLKNPYEFCPPGGESFQALMERARDWIAGLPDGRTAAVTHGGVIRAVVHSVLGIPKENAWRLSFDNCSITKLQFDEWGTVLHTLNDCSHLENLQEA
jgi:alpha-ribazole phosphatase